jgi:hypothetical protein
MSFQITEAFVQQFASNVFHLAQQKGSRLRGAVRVESQVGKSAFYDRIGKVTAQLKTSRHSDTPQLDTPHSRRRVTLADYEWADLVDQQDKIRLLIDPASAYSQAAMYALGRSMDDVIVAAISGTAYSGESGATSVSLGNGQKIVPVSGGAAVNLSVSALRNAKKILDANDVDPSIPRYLALNASGLNSLLGQTEVTSSDYNTVKALVQGEVDTFMGFKFIRTERLATASSTTYNTSTGAVGSGSTLSNGVKCLAWAGDGVLLSIGKDMMGRISERDDKSYAMQVYACMSIGATRLEEEKVVEIICNQA